MISLKKIEDKDIYTFSMEGKINETDIKKFYTLLEEKVAKHEKIKLLGIIKEFPHFEDFKTIGEALKMKMTGIKGIAKYAVLTDKNWVENVLPIGNFVTPGLPIKAFNLNEKAKAIEWLDKDETIKKEAFYPSGIEKIEGTDIYTFTIDGKFTEEQVDDLYHYFQSIRKDKKVKLLIDIRSFKGFENIKTLIKGIKTDLKIIGNVKKYAVLTEKRWLSDIVKLGGAITPGLSLKVFEHSQRDKAINWLKEKKLSNRAVGNIALTAFLSLLIIPVLYAAVEAIDSKKAA